MAEPIVRKRGGAGNGVIEYRRRLVASLLVRFPTIRQREIQHRIGEKVINYETGNPYSLGTVNHDIQEIKKEWREMAARDYDTWLARELAGLDEVEGEAWNQKKLDIVLRCKERRSRLLGLDQPSRLEHTGPEGGPQEVKYSFDFSSLTDDELETLAKIARKITAGD